MHLTQGLTVGDSLPEKVDQSPSHRTVRGPGIQPNGPAFLLLLLAEAEHRLDRRLQRDPRVFYHRLPTILTLFRNRTNHSLRRTSEEPATVTMTDALFL